MPNILAFYSQEKERGLPSFSWGKVVLKNQILAEYDRNLSQESQEQNKHPLFRIFQYKKHIFYQITLLDWFLTKKRTLVFSPFGSRFFETKGSKWLRRLIAMLQLFQPFFWAMGFGCPLSRIWLTPFFEFSDKNVCVRIYYKSSRYSTQKRYCRTIHLIIIFCKRLDIKSTLKASPCLNYESSKLPGSL